MPVYRKHREYFYDWCGIGSIYGAPPAGTYVSGAAGNWPVAVNAKVMQEVLRSDEAELWDDIMLQADISTIHYLHEEHLSDEKCNALCKST